MITRRGWLRAAMLTPLAAPSVAQAAITPGGRPRALAFENLHTGERLAVEYWAGGQYVSDSLRRIDRVLRDHRNDQVHGIDPALLDLLVQLSAGLGTGRPFQVISGYRSPASNAMLAAASGGVARDSLHTQGKAIDIRVEGVPLPRLREAALALRAGGVGYYPKSNFVHVDTGRVRFW